MRPSFYHVLSILILFAAFFWCLYGLHKKPQVNEYRPEEDNNLDRQRILIVKLTAKAISESECDYVDALINHYEKMFIDYPDIVNEVEELRHNVDIQRNYLKVMTA